MVVRQWIRCLHAGVSIIIFISLYFAIKVYNTDNQKVLQHYYMNRLFTYPLYYLSGWLSVST